MPKPIRLDSSASSLRLADDPDRLAQMSSRIFSSPARCSSFCAAGRKVETAADALAAERRPLLRRLTNAQHARTGTRTLKLQLKLRPPAASCGTAFASACQGRYRALQSMVSFKPPRIGLIAIADLPHLPQLIRSTILSHNRSTVAVGRIRDLNAVVGFVVIVAAAPARCPVRWNRSCPAPPYRTSRIPPLGKSGAIRVSAILCCGSRIRLPPSHRPLARLNEQILLAIPTATTPVLLFTSTEGRSPAAASAPSWSYRSYPQSLRYRC